MFRNFSVEDFAVLAIALDEEFEFEDETQKKKTICSTSNE